MTRAKLSVPRRGPQALGGVAALVLFAQCATQPRVASTEAKVATSCVGRVTRLACPAGTVADMSAESQSACSQSEGGAELKNSDGGAAGICNYNDGCHFACKVSPGFCPCGAQTITVAAVTCASCDCRDQRCPVGTYQDNSRQFGTSGSAQGATFGRDGCRYTCRAIQTCPTGTVPFVTETCFTCTAQGGNGNAVAPNCNGGLGQTIEASNRCAPGRHFRASSQECVLNYSWVRRKAGDGTPNVVYANPPRGSMVCRAQHDAGVTPGYLAADGCHIGWGNHELIKAEFEVLMGPQQPLWAPGRNGGVPPHSLPGGFENGYDLPICRAIVDGHHLAGKVVSQCCSVGLENEEKCSTEYDVLLQDQ
jgi:hypothetical protein